MIAMSVIGLTSMAQTAKPSPKAAQTEQQGGRAKHKGMKDHMSDLNLTDAQKTQAKEIRERYKTQLQDLQKNESITVKEQRERRQTLMTQQRAEMDKILTPEQRTKMQADHKGMGDKRSAMRGDRMKGSMKELDLTSAQQTKMKTLNESMRTKMQSIQKDQALISDQKKEQLKSLREQHKNDVAAILTSEQKQKLGTLQTDRRSRTK